MRGRDAPHGQHSDVVGLPGIALMLLHSGSGVVQQGSSRFLGLLEQLI
jgi:hypothetical protein